MALETTLVAALRALLAVHTDLLEDRFPRTITPAGFWAERLIYLGGHMADALAKYRAAIDEKEVPPTDFEITLRLSPADLSAGDRRKTMATNGKRHLSADSHRRLQALLHDTTPARFTPPLDDDRKIQVEDRRRQRDSAARGFMGYHE